MKGTEQQRAKWKAAYLRSRDRVWARQIKKKFGLSEGDYNSILREQSNGCAICTLPCNTGKRLAVDHDHNTGAVRGLLCAKCNTALGKFNDDPQLVLKGVAYLLKHHGAKPTRSAPTSGTSCSLSGST